MPDSIKNQTEEKQLYTVNDLAWELQCGTNNIYYILRTYAVPTIKVGNRVFVRRADWNAFLESRVKAG